VSFIATLRLLNASVVVAISGAFRVYVAFLLLGVEPVLPISFAILLVTYSTYTLDRAIKTEEDEVNRREEKNARRGFVFLIACTSLLAAITILIEQGVFPAIAFYPLVVGFAYSKGIKIGRSSIRLKNGYGIKNIAVAFTWASTVSTLIYPWSESYPQLLLIFSFFFLKSFVNTVICDCRDVKGDSLAGLASIPVCFGEEKTKTFLQLLHSSFHLSVTLLILLDMVKFETIILLYSWGIGLVYIHLYANNRKTLFRSTMVHGEWVHMLIFRDLVIRLSRSASHST
jgi:4-hydroxybenzoate polyprenyltransferase